MMQIFHVFEDEVNEMIVQQHNHFLQNSPKFPIGQEPRETMKSEEFYIVFKNYHVWSIFCSLSKDKYKAKKKMITVMMID